MPKSAAMPMTHNSPSGMTPPQRVQSAHPKGHGDFMPSKSMGGALGQQPTVAHMNATSKEMEAQIKPADFVSQG